MAERTAAYLDCTAGVAGDMLLGSLLAAGAPPDAVSRAVEALGIDGLAVSSRRDRRGGLACTLVEVNVPSAPDRERRLGDILALLERAALNMAVREVARQTFDILARAEAAVHGISHEEVHFHEVGAYDALADVVGVAAACEALGLLALDAEVACSPLEAGTGRVAHAHGSLPVPVPVVLEIARAHGLPLNGGSFSGECTTPTGAALVAALARPGPLLRLTVTAVGCGGGRRDTPDRPNVTRAVIGHLDRAAGSDVRTTCGSVAVVESMVDDLDPRFWPGVLEALRDAGAWDCWVTPVLGRSGRLGHQVTALCSEHLRPAVAETMFRHTSTLGVRWSTVQRETAHRTRVEVVVGPPEDPQPVSLKIAGPTVQPEFDDVRRAARALGWPERQVAQTAIAAHRRAMT